MTRFLILAAYCSLATAAPLPKDKPAGPLFLDLKGNHKLKDSFGSGRFAGNDLSSLPSGERTFGGVKFKVGDAMLQLGSARVPGKPAKFEGLKVGRTLAKLHFLHSTGYSAEDGEVIAKYVVHYADGTKAEAEVAYGKDVVDWWAYAGQEAPKVGKTAWEGQNEPSKEYDAKVRLYLMTWKNPHPTRKVVSLDYVATAAEKDAAPFCVAITADE